MVLCELTMFPTDKGSSVSPWVARILDIIDRSGVPYVLTPMGTILEGNWDEVMVLAGKCFAALEPDCERISVAMKIDYRKGTESRLQSKTRKIEAILGRALRG